MSKRKNTLTANAIDVLGPDGPASEFRVFAAGVNRTTNGNFTFDLSLPDNPFAGYLARAVDVMIDLEHLSIPGSDNFDPDARGWCKLEMRGGELWAVDVRWTADGARRLAEKTQRYISPTFDFGDEEGSIGMLFNLALVANPAMFGAPALIAASASVTATQKLKNGKTMAAKDAPPEEETPSGANDGDVLAQIAAFLGLEPPFTATSFIAAVKGLQTAATTGDDAPGASADDSPDDGSDPELAMDPPPPAKPGAPPVKPTAKQLSATRRALLRATGKPSAREALADVAIWKAGYAELSASKKAVADEREALDFERRIALAQKLVQRGFETPATSGLNSLRVVDGKTTVTLATAMLIPLPELEARVVALCGATPATSPTAPKAKPDLSTVGLTQEELEMCARKKLDPETFAKSKAKLAASKLGKKISHGV